MSFDPDRFKKALDFAATVHKDQFVPGSGAPYLVHIVKVAMEVMVATEQDPASDRDLAVTCALLHDTIEDAPPEDRARVRSELVAAFGETVAGGVEALSKDETLPKADRMSDSLRRIQEGPREIWLVKLADRITNLEPPPARWTLEKRRGYVAEARTILDALGAASPGLTERFEIKLREYAAYCS